MPIKRPMLAATLDRLSLVKYPVLATPKVDGIRCLIVNGKPVSRTFKPIPAPYVTQFTEGLPEGFDGELIIPGATFQETVSAVMTQSETSLAKMLEYWVFDWFAEDGAGYAHRCMRFFEWGMLEPTKYLNVKLLTPIWCHNEEDLLKFNEVTLEEGFEGVCFRVPLSPYKAGRSTLKEGFLVKWKPFYEDEATVVGFEERNHNANPQTRDNFGLAERSSHSALQLPTNTLGALVVHTIRFGNFNVGSGFTEQERLDIWNDKESYLGAKITFKYLAHGMKDKPRHPVF